MIRFTRTSGCCALLLLALAGLPACSSDSATAIDDTPLTMYPVDGDVLTADFAVRVGAAAVDSVVVHLDGARLGVVTAPPFVWPIALVDFRPGEHLLAVTVCGPGTERQLSAEVLLCHGLGLKVGNFAPQFTLEGLDGETHAPGRLPGTKVVLLDFWASWCPPCISALPETQRLFEEYGRQGLQVLTIDDEPREIIRPFVEANQYTFPVLLDADYRVGSLFDVRAIPTYYLIDHRGVVRFVKVGAGGTPLEDVIKALL